VTILFTIFIIRSLLLYDCNHLLGYHSHVVIQLLCPSTYYCQLAVRQWCTLRGVQCRVVSGFGVPKSVHVERQYTNPVELAEMWVRTCMNILLFLKYYYF